MQVQKTTWGEIQWLHTPKPYSNQSIIIGITNIGGGEYLQRHVHYGQEQFIYILQGKCQYTINGTSRIFHAGDYVYFPPNAEHETRTLGNEPLRELIIYNSVMYHPEGFYEQNDESDAEQKLFDNILSVVVEIIRSTVLEPLRMPVTLTDKKGQLIWQGTHFSEYCRYHCDIGDENKNCPCLNTEHVICNGRAEKEYTCPYGLTVFYVPILFHQQYIGSVTGGHIFFSERSGSSAMEKLYDMPMSSVMSLRGLLRQVVQNIHDMCEFYVSRQELLEKNEQLTQSRQALGAVNDTVTNLKINHHFLFNTLNSMASMAVSESGEALYDAILNLAKFFRYTMTDNLRFVPLKSELTYLQTYLDLQKLRYQERLTYTCDIAAHTEETAVPFNFLQPIVENAFTHGFKNLVSDKRVIRIQSFYTSPYVEVKIYNNGTPIEEATRKRVLCSMRSQTGHGMSFIYEKLHSAYGEDFILDYLPEDGGTVAYIRLPFKSLSSSTQGLSGSE